MGLVQRFDATCSLVIVHSIDVHYVIIAFEFLYLDRWFWGPNLTLKWFLSLVNRRANSCLNPINMLKLMRVNVWLRCGLALIWAEFSWFLFLWTIGLLSSSCKSSLISVFSSDKELFNVSLELCFITASLFNWATTLKSGLLLWIFLNVLLLESVLVFSKPDECYLLEVFSSSIVYLGISLIDYSPFYFSGLSSVVWSSLKKEFYVIWFPRCKVA